MLVFVASTIFMIGILIGVFGTFSLEAQDLIREYKDSERLTYLDALAIIDTEYVKLLVKEKRTEEDEIKIKVLEDILRKLSEVYEKSGG